MASIVTVEALMQPQRQGSARLMNPEELIAAKPRPTTDPHADATLRIVDDDHRLTASVAARLMGELLTVLVPRVRH